MRSLRTLTLLVVLFAHLVFGGRLALADPLYYSVDVVNQGGAFQETFRDIGRCGELVGSRRTIPVFGGQPYSVPLVRHGGEARVVRVPGAAGELVAVNRDGRAVGHFFEGGQTRPFLLADDDVVVPLPVPDARAIVTDLDDSGTWAVGYDSVPFVWQILNEAGEVWAEVHELPLPGGSWGQANGVNRAGEIVGSAQAGDGSIHAVVWRPLEDGGYEIVDLGIGFGLGIADSGMAVGSVRNKGGVSQAFAWRDGESVLLAHPAGCTSCESYAFRVNEAGQVAGHVKSASGESRATLWDLETGAALDLAEAALEGPSGIALTSVLEVNDMGDVLASAELDGGFAHVVLRPFRDEIIDGDGNGVPDRCETVALEAGVESATLEVDEMTSLWATATTATGAQVEVATQPGALVIVEPESALEIGDDGTVIALEPGPISVTVRFGGHFATFRVTVGHTLEPCIGHWPRSRLGPRTFTFTAGCSEGTSELATVRWDFGDGTLTTGETVTHTFAELGAYEVSVTVVDVTGATSTTSIEVDVDEPPAPAPVFLRGDANGDRVVNLSDAVASLNDLFRGMDLVHCDAAADTNDDDSFDISDPVTTLIYLFLGEATIPAPGVITCGNDPTPGLLGCNDPGACGKELPADPVTGYRPDDYSYGDMDRGVPERPRPADGSDMHTQVRKGELWEMPGGVSIPDDDGDDPRDTPPPVIFGEEIDAVKKRPLILVPGIMASLLEDSRDGTHLWPPYDEAKGGARPLADLSNASAGGRSQPSARGKGGLVPGFYGRLIHFLENDMKYKLGQTLFIFPYDWTQSNKSSGRKLAAFVRIVQNSHEPPWEDVDVICHSMGGLVTRSAIVFNSAPINRTIYLASPHYGASKAYFFLHPDVAPVAGDGLKGFVARAAWHYLDNKAGVTAAAQSFASAWELLPDRNYFQVPEHVAKVDGRLIGGPRVTYLYVGWPTHFREQPQKDKVVTAMQFKDDLGPNLPGTLNLVLYNGRRTTSDRVDWDDGFGSPYDSGQKGDETVPTSSAKGPGAATQVGGAHTALPNMRSTHTAIAAFIVATGG